MVIHLERLNCGPAYIRAPHQPGTVPLEVLAPFVLTRVKEWCVPSGQRIATVKIRALVPVAVKTGKCQIAQNGSSKVFHCNYVVDLKCSFVILLRDQAVLTERPRPSPHFLLKALIHLSRRTLAMLEQLAGLRLEDRQ